MEHGNIIRRRRRKRLSEEREEEKERERRGKKAEAGGTIACVPEPIDKELFRDVVLAVGILEREVELVVLVEHVEARLRLRSRTA